MSSRHPGESARTYTARLRCGVVLTYEAGTFVPNVEEVVPCRRHGYCPVASRGQVEVRKRPGPGRTVQRRSQGELLDFLRRRPVTSLHALRENRFTLRTVTAAQRDGLVDVDLVTGRIALRCAAVE
jgi:hypothetical protein